MASLTEQILSEDYHDFILPYNLPGVLEQFRDYGAQFLDSRYMLVHSRSSYPPFIAPNVGEVFNTYPFIPKLFTTLSTVSLENSGIIQVQTQPNLNLSGKGMLIGFLDTGIDYTHPAFLDASGRTRIAGIWDQTIQDGAETNPFHYGTFYTEEQINEALRSPDPKSVVPSTDTDGHGTFLAGAAAGTPDPESDFTGVAYDARICMVKLKPAKQYLLDYYFASRDAVVFQENDLMMALNYLMLQADQLQLPLTICIGLGTNQGDHAGNSPLSGMISYLSYISYTIFAVAGGNEGGRGHHYYHMLENGNSDSVEILIPENTTGFVAELWGSGFSLLSVGFQSPIGTQIAPITSRPGKTETVSFILEQTVITISFSVVSESGGDPLIVFRFQNPTPGSWIIRVNNKIDNPASFHMWLPITGILEQDVRFLNPNPNTTLTVPANTEDAITTAAYNAENQSLYIHSGRGYARNGEIKPNLTSPGVNITGPALGGGYHNQTGSSTAAAILAGSIALIQQWSMELPNPHPLNNLNMNSYLIRGATRDPGIEYPNREWGYGKLNVYNIFTTLIS